MQYLQEILHLSCQAHKLELIECSRPITFFIVSLMCNTTFCLATFPLKFHDGDGDGDGDEIPVHVLCILENEKPQWLIHGIFFRKWTLSVHVQPEQVFRPIGVLNRFTELRHSKVKYKIIFYPASSPLSPSSLLKLPNYLRPGSNAVLHISRTHEPNPMLIIYAWIVAVNIFDDIPAIFQIQGPVTLNCTAGETLILPWKTTAQQDRCLISLVKQFGSTELRSMFDLN